MAKAKKTRGTTRKKTTRRPTPRRTTKRSTRAIRSSGAAATRRIAELEAENRRLRDEIASLRGGAEERAESSAPLDL